MQIDRDRAKEIFADAVEKSSASERAAFLDEACGEDDALRREVEDLLGHQAHLGSFLAGAPAPPVAAGPGPGTTIGPYRILEVIGEGGFGVVHVAEQTAPVRRRVALKVLKAGMDTREVVARFEAERQALALMDHPHIARVFDGGTTPEGRPYFVMELVQGIPIQEYCDRSRLPLRERLALFVQVCRAVQHAHQKGVIHRDLKPSNVLVSIQDGAPAPKVIDFGVAKAIGRHLTDATFHTRFAQMIGTPQYMSPEQAEMSALDVDTRSDVYALGVLLYELLTGAPPLTLERLETATFDELRRMIREEEPPTPSERLTNLNGDGEAVAAARRTDLPRLVRRVRGDLDWIVMRALEKDRTRRYESASALASDVERHLADEPVEARPPSVVYRLRKFARRHRRAMVVAAIVLAAAIVAGWNLRERALREARLAGDVEVALQEAARLQGEARGLTDHPERWTTRLEAARSALQRAESLLAAMDASADHPLRERTTSVRSGLEGEEEDRRLLADLERRLLEDPPIGSPGIPGATRHEVAVQVRESAARYRTTYGSLFEPGAVSPDAAAGALRGKRPEIRAFLVSGLDAWAELAREVDDPDAAWLAAVIEAADPDPWRRAVRVARRAGDRERLLSLADAESAPKDASSILLLATTLGGLGAKDRAGAVLAQGVEQDPGDFRLVSALAGLLAVDRPAEAAVWFRVARALRPGSAGVHVGLNYALYESGDPEGALTAALRAVELDPELAEAWVNLGYTLTGQDRLDEAAHALEQAVDLAPKLVTAYLNLATVRRRQGDRATAIEVLHRAATARPECFFVYAELGDVLRENGQAAEAEAAFRKGLECVPKGHRAVLLNKLGLLLNERGAFRDAIAVLDEALELDPALFPAHVNLANAWGGLDDLEKALAHAVEGVKQGKGNVDALMTLGNVRMARGETGEAIVAIREALEIAPTSAKVLLNLGCALFEGQDFEGAEARFRSALELEDDEVRPFAWNDLGLALQAQGRQDEALSAFRRAVALAPDYPEANVHLGLQLGMRDDVDGAIRHLGRAAESRPDLPQALNGLAWHLATHPDPARRDPRRAVELATRATEILPDDGGVWNTLGVALLRAGEAKGAVNALSRSMRLQGTNAYDGFFLAMAHHELGEEDAARRYYDEAVELQKVHAPGNAELERFRAEAAKLLDMTAVAGER